MEKYLEYYRNHLQLLNKSANTTKQYCIDIDQFLKFAKESEHSIDSELEALLREYIEDLQKKYRTTLSVNRKISSLKSFLVFLSYRNVIDHVPEHLLKPKKVSKTELQTFSEKDLLKIIQFWRTVNKESTDPEFKWISLRNFCIVYCIATLGLKPAEVVAMKWLHIQDNELLILNRTKKRKNILKNELIDLLNFYYNETTTIFPLIDPNSPMWLGIGNRQYEAITVKTIERIFQTISKKLGFKVTATSIRYSLINRELMTEENSSLDEIYSFFGYARKSVLVDRVNRFSTSGKNGEELHESIKFE